MNDETTGQGTPPQSHADDHSKAYNDAEISGKTASVAPNDAAALPHAEDGHADPVIPVAPAPVTVQSPTSDSNVMDRSGVKELVQMVGAMTFVTLLIAVGWHAAHYSGAWPY